MHTLGFRAIAALIAFSLFVAGCGGARTVPVSGQITAGGKPVADLHVSFQPRAKDDTGRAGPPSTGVTDAEGRFQLFTFDPVLEGAVPGDHVVVFSLNQKDEGPQTDDSGRYDPTAQFLPPKAYDGSVRFTVPDGGTEEANFELTKL
jgi:hypothetical protein